MSSRLALESWQLALPAIGLAIFAAIFFGVVFRVWRMKRPAVTHLEHLPLADESVPERVVPAHRAATSKVPTTHVS